LARIVAVFASVDKLQAKYGIVVKKESVVAASGEKRKPRFWDRLSTSLSVRLRSKSPSPSTSTQTSVTQTSVTQTSISGATTDDLHLLENPRVLGDERILPGLDDEIKSMTEAINRVQQSLPISLKLRWVIWDKAKLEELLGKLTSLNNGLFRVLPTSESALNSLQGSLLKLSFDIPFLPNIRKYSEFVGREYLLENLK